MNNIVEALGAMISADTETLSVMPRKSKKNIQEYENRLDELKRKYKKIRKFAVIEIKERYRRIIRKNVKPEINQIKEEIGSFKDLDLLNDDLTSYEKMGLDEVSYNLNHFYKNDLNLINEQILKGIKSFQKCNIKLSASDFNYNKYTKQYMATFFEELDKDLMNSENIKDVFEDIYWKCSNIMKLINLNFYYLYFNNQKEIDKYYKNEKAKLLDEYKLNSRDIITKYESLKEMYFKKYNSDEFVLLSKFVYDKADISRYTDAEIISEYSKLTKVDLGKIGIQELETLNDNIYKLSNTLYEYKKYLEYKFIIDDMKQRNTIASKQEYDIGKELKTISDKENKLMAYNTKIQKGKLGLFESKGKIEALSDKSDEIINELEQLYEKYEESYINSQIKKLFTENSTIYDLLKYAANHYLYFCECLKKNLTEEEQKEINKQEKIKQLKEFLSNPQFNVFIKNVKINDDKNIDQIIIDRYFLFNIEIPTANLKEEGIDDLIETANKIVLYNNVKSSEISINDIKFMCDLKRISGK